ncbi:MAG: hypothetical protein RL326_536 [Pseudomonadota bacterium]
MKRRPGQPIERTEETFEVGLDRHMKQESRLPAWLVDYGIWIFVGFLFLIIVLPYSVFGSRGLFGGSVPNPQAPQAQLSIVSVPTKVWLEGSRTKLKSVQVKVGNRGQGQASAVEVLASIRGELFPLQGPTKLSSGSVAQYAGPSEISISENETIQIVLRCETCAQ